MIIAETKAPGGWREIAIRAQDRSLIAVITHPCAGAKWFLHRADSRISLRFATKKAALAAALQEQTNA